MKFTDTEWAQAVSELSRVMKTAITPTTIYTEAEAREWFKKQNKPYQAIAVFKNGADSKAMYTPHNRNTREAGEYWLHFCLAMKAKGWLVREMFEWKRGQLLSMEFGYKGESWPDPEPLTDEIKRAIVDWNRR
jgi:hypothetical protein